jgi:hypothetical protein
MNNADLFHLLHKKPYTYELVPGKGWFADRSYEIKFEGQVVLNADHMHPEDIHTTVNMLNAAYTLGVADTAAKFPMQD